MAPACCLFCLLELLKTLMLMLLTHWEATGEIQGLQGHKWSVQQKKKSEMRWICFCWFCGKWPSEARTHSACRTPLLLQLDFIQCEMPLGSMDPSDTDCWCFLWSLKKKKSNCLKFLLFILFSYPERVWRCVSTQRHSSALWWDGSMNDSLNPDPSITHSVNSPLTISSHLFGTERWWLSLQS